MCIRDRDQKASQNSSEPAAEPAPASALSKEEKELRKITKKLREIEKLQSSVDEGTVTPDETQLAKLAKYATVQAQVCLLYTSDAADEEDSVDLGGRRIIKKKKRIYTGYNTSRII
eukprot:TRINITY_DN1955_c0_g1_i1.p2 TRINITY_DN1955_c0_g1~~TRINITY_DN1955_c0_g1_i1.p2  ORF type:complete len:116 (-),score=29.01 TRINITY_DN1955_c0_g1_i1:22-369(-)